MKPCENCANSTAKQKNVYKEITALNPKNMGGQVYLGMSKVTVSRDDDSDFDLNKNNWKSMVVEDIWKK